MATIDVTTEQEAARGWRYEVAITRDRGTQADELGRPATAIETTRHVVTLSWADHEHWCGGAKAPSRVVEAVISALLVREGDVTASGEIFSLPARFDAATARRWFPEIDDEFMSRL